MLAYLPPRPPGTTQTSPSAVHTELFRGQEIDVVLNKSVTLKGLLIFDEPQRLRRILLVFEENETKRTQEFVLRWSPDGGRSFQEIVRQQWNFSPPNRPRSFKDTHVGEENLINVHISNIRKTFGEGLVY
jgi:hypothetical protein